MRLTAVMMLGALIMVSPLARAADKGAGSWAFTGGVGFLSNTTDDTAFAANLQLDYFLTRNVSIGPLAQLAFTDDLSQIGLSGQARYWLPVAPEPSLKLVFQGGIGFVHADQNDDDTSFLIPLGVGLHYPLNQDISLDATFLINFTDLEVGPGGGNDTSVMPGMTFGIRF